MSGQLTSPKRALLLGKPEARVFVYGTLLAGGGMQGLLAAFPRESARTRGRLYALPAGYPAMIADLEAPWVEGELIDLQDPRALRLVDHYEGVDRGLYKRVVVPVAHGGRSSSAWAYTMTAEGVRGLRGRRLPGGSWIEYKYPTKR